MVKFIYVACRQGYVESDENGYSWHYDMPEAAFDSLDKAWNYIRQIKHKYPCRCEEKDCEERNQFLVKELALV